MANFTLFNSGKKQLAGLDISSSSVKLLELSGSPRAGYQVERYVIEPLPRDAVVDGNVSNLDAVSDGVLRALRKFGSGVRNVAMALPASAVITKQVALPGGLREKEMELEIEMQADQYIPFPLDEVNIDFEVMGPAAGRVGEEDVLVVASRKDKVEDREAVAESAGLHVAVVDVASFAMEAAFELVSETLPGRGHGKIIALINIGSTTMNITVFQNGATVYSREQPFGGHQLTQDIARQYGMSLDEAERAKREGSLPGDYANDLLKPFLNKLALEVSRGLQFFFTSTQYSKVDYAVLSGGTALLPGVTESVASRVQVETRLANPFANMRFSSRVRTNSLEHDAPSLMVACGLALRRFDA